MNNEEIVVLLREIRDLQKVHAENYKESIKNQQAAIELATNARRFQKRALLVLLIVVLLAMAVSLLPSLAVR